MACRDWAAKVGGGVLGRVWALVAALALFLGLAATVPAPAQAASFRDVPSGQWYTSWVDKASDQGLMSGFTDPATGRPTGYFGPDEPLTRAQVATVLWRMADGPSSGHASFPDVERGSWYDAPVAWCVKAGVVTGYTSGPDRGYFRPDRPVTRQELATMVYRYAKYAGMDVADPDPTAFRSTTDWRTADSWASEALTWTAAAGVLSGVDNHDGTYSVVPFGTATRAMAAKVFVVLSGSPSAAKASYTVTFDSNGGSAVKAQTVKNGDWAQMPAVPSRKDYKFVGWYTDKTFLNEYGFYLPVVNNITLYAKWEPRFYAVLYTDGLLSLQLGSDEDSSHGKTIRVWEWDGESSPWYDKRARVKSVVVRDAVSVKGSCWQLFCDLFNCKRMDLTNLDVSGASHLYGMFQGCGSLQSLDLSGWDVSNVTNMSNMFEGCSSLISIDFTGWNPSGTSDFSGMFSGCSSLRSIDVSNWDVSSASNFFIMFQGCSSLADLDLSKWDVSNAATFENMFFNCSSLTALDLSGWDVSNVGDFSRMFAGCSSLSSLDVSGWDVSNASDLARMFSGCSSLSSLNLSGWDVSNVVNFSFGYRGGMFSDCSSLASLDLSGWDVSGATSLSYMFSGCSSLRSLDLSGWEVSSAADLSYMFDECSSLGTVALGAGCGALVEKLPSGPWYDAEGKQYDRPPAGVAGTFTKTKSATLALTADGASDADALLSAQIVEGEWDGLRYAVVPEGTSFEYGLEYSKIAGRYVGPGVYVTGYVGEDDSVTVPLEIDGVVVVSANLSWNDSGRAGMTRLASVSFERAEGKVSSLVQLDVSGNGLSSLDIEGLDALVRLNCEDNPIADLAQLQMWAAVEGHEARLPQVQDVAPAQPAAGDNAQAPSEPQEPASPDVPTKPAEPANPESSSAEPEEPSDPAVPSEPEQPGSSDVSGEPDQPGGDSVGSDMGESEQPEEPADTVGLGESGRDGDASATEEQAGAIQPAELTEESFALAA